MFFLFFLTEGGGGKKRKIGLIWIQAFFFDECDPTAITTTKYVLFSSDGTICNLFGQEEFILFIYSFFV